MAEKSAKKLSKNSARKSVTESSLGTMSKVVVILAHVAIILTFPISIYFCLRTINEYERAVVFRLGRNLQGKTRGPGVFFINPLVDRIITVDYRTISFDVPAQELLTMDHVTILVDAVVYYRVFDAVMAVVNVQYFQTAVRLLSASILRNNLSNRSLGEILTGRESISRDMEIQLDDGTDPWGIKVERVEIKDIRLPRSMQRAMASEAEAMREAKAKVIAAYGEKSAAEGLREAADEMSKSSYALQLRYLQTMTAMAAEKDSTIVFPIPISIFDHTKKIKE